MSDTQSTYRVQFSTPTVKPEVFPDFVYAASEVAFDYVLYTALVKGSGLFNVTEKVKACWPQAQIRFVEAGVDEFRRTDTTGTTKYFGSLLEQEKDAAFISVMKAPFAWAFVR